MAKCNEPVYQIQSIFSQLQLPLRQGTIMHVDKDDIFGGDCCFSICEDMTSRFVGNFDAQCHKL